MEDWSITPRQAAQRQRELARRVIRQDQYGEIRRVAGVDVHFPRSGPPSGQGSDRQRVAHAAVCVLSFAGLEPLEEVTERREIAFPYVPGLLSFREMPPILAALGDLEGPPDLLLCDGHGYAHPRRFGLACHLGVLTDTPSIGVAKSRLIGDHPAVPAHRGGWCPLVDRGETIGAVLRTRESVKPVYVSVGHRISLESAVRLVMRCTSRFRLPEPSRCAHRLASRGR